MHLAWFCHSVYSELHTWVRHCSCVCSNFEEKDILFFYIIHIPSLVLEDFSDI